MKDEGFKNINYRGKRLVRKPAVGGKFVMGKVLPLKLPPDAFKGDYTIKVHAGASLPIEKDY